MHETPFPASPTVHALSQRSPQRSAPLERRPTVHTPTDRLPQELRQRPLSMMSTPVSSPLPPPTSSTPLSLAVSTDASDATGAKHERKLLDLEITNKSLISINTSLEAAKVRQGREIHSLRRQLVNSRIAAAHGNDVSAGVTDSDESQGDVSDAGDAAAAGFATIDKLAQQDVELERAHVRCRNMISYMIEEARMAMLTRPEAVGGKVLHASELDTSIPTSHDTDLSATQPSSPGDASLLHSPSRTLESPLALRGDAHDTSVD